MKNIHILLVEDNKGDVLLTVEALEDAKIINKVSVVYDGKEALDFLTKAGEYAHVETPDLILLDVNLPKKSGHEVLQFIKSHDTLKEIPVIMLTTSSSEKDINLSYKNKANYYITKPVEAGRLLEVVAAIGNFWISIIQLPTIK